MSAALHDSIRIVEGHLDFSTGIVGIDGIAAVDAGTAVIGQTIEDDGTAPVSAHAYLEIVIRIVQIVIGEAVNGGGFRLHVAALTRQQVITDWV